MKTINLLLTNCEAVKFLFLYIINLLICQKESNMIIYFNLKQDVHVRVFVKYYAPAGNTFWKSYF